MCAHILLPEKILLVARMCVCAHINCFQKQTWSLEPRTWLCAQMPLRIAPWQYMEDVKSGVQLHAPSLKIKKTCQKYAIIYYLFSCKLPFGKFGTGHIAQSNSVVTFHFRRPAGATMLFGFSAILPAKSWLAELPLRARRASRAITPTRIASYELRVTATSAQSEPL